MKSCLVVVVALLTVISACGCSSSKTGDSSGTGLASASSRIDKGVVLYNQDGTSFGTVSDFSENHQFPEGTDRGVEVDGTWYKRSFVANSKYVKE